MFLISQNSSWDEDAGKIHWTYRRMLEVETTPWPFLLFDEQSIPSDFNEPN